MANHLFDAIRATAAPEAVFIETAEGRRWTYGDMIRLSGQLAHALARRGVTPGDRYLWVLDEQGLPTAWQMWVRILKIDGLEATWEDWVTLPAGAKISTRHRILGLPLVRITDLVAAERYEALPP